MISPLIWWFHMNLKKLFSVVPGTQLDIIQVGLLSRVLKCMQSENKTETLLN